MAVYWSDKSGGSAMVDYALVIIVVFLCYSDNQVAAVKCVYPPRGYIGDRKSVVRERVYGDV